MSYSIMPKISHLNIHEELMALFMDTYDNDQSIFCLMNFKKFMQANYTDEDIKVYFPCLYKKLFLKDTTTKGLKNG